MRAIRQFARQVAERFYPEKIILFGSYAYGTPHADSEWRLGVLVQHSSDSWSTSRLPVPGAGGKSYDDFAAHLESLPARPAS